MFEQTLTEPSKMMTPIITKDMQLFPTGHRVRNAAGGGRLRNSKSVSYSNMKRTSSSNISDKKQISKSAQQLVEIAHEQPPSVQPQHTRRTRYISSLPSDLIGTIEEETAECGSERTRSTMSAENLSDGESTSKCAKEKHSKGPMLMSHIKSLFHLKRRDNAVPSPSLPSPEDVLPDI